MRQSLQVFFYFQEVMLSASVVTVALFYIQMLL